MQTNRAAVGVAVLTHEGTPAAHLTPIKTLRRVVLSCLLFEDTFYEKGTTISANLGDLIAKCKPDAVAALAVEARDRMYLRHVPLFLVAELSKRPGCGTLVTDTLAHVIQRPDELGEYLALYWGGTKHPVSAGSKRGLARAFQKFSAYQLAKYDRDTTIKLRDVMRIVHAKPKTPEQAATWKQMIARTLPTPDTWETELSAGKDKRETFERLMREGKLGGLAVLRNLRNMIEAKVDEGLIRTRLREGKFEKVLPFRFIAAARHAPRFEPDLEGAMMAVCKDLPPLAGITALVIDTSPSMWMAKVSAKSELDRFDAAAALAILVRERCASVDIYAFNQRAYEVPSRRGFALRDALASTKGQASCGGLAVQMANERGYDRIIVLTDGQWHYPDVKALYGYREGKAQEMSPVPLTANAYMVNLAPYQTGVGYGPWVSIDGWSERVLDFVVEHERELA